MPTTPDADARSERIREIAYRVIDRIGRRRIAETASKSTREAMRAVLERSRRMTDRLGGDAEQNTAVLLTVLLHYFLALAMIPSQRRVSVRGTEIDVVLPDVRTLAARPADCVIICIPGARGAGLGEQISAMESVQPHARNIWYVTEHHTGRRTYSIHDGTILGILDDAREFLSSRTQSRLFAT